MREEQPLPCVPRMVHVRLLNSFYFLQAATSDNLSTSYTDKTNIHSDFSFVNIYNSNMNDCKELTYEQVRELAIARYVMITKSASESGLNRMATSRRRDKKITGFTPFTSR